MIQYNDSGAIVNADQGTRTSEDAIVFIDSLALIIRLGRINASCSGQKMEFERMRAV
jgi:hypothetical protein